jgi:hypothetical protein
MQQKEKSTEKNNFAPSVRSYVDRRKIAKRVEFVATAAAKSLLDTRRSQQTKMLCDRCSEITNALRNVIDSQDWKEGDESKKEEICIRIAKELTELCSHRICAPMETEFKNMAWMEWEGGFVHEELNRMEELGERYSLSDKVMRQLNSYYLTYKVH